MEIAKVVSILEETTVLLRTSLPSEKTSMTVGELMDALEAEIARAREEHSTDTDRLKMLFAPTGPIQEISIDNGWGNDFLRISQIMDGLLGNP
jgi:hypothetical protein